MLKYILLPTATTTTTATTTAADKLEFDLWCSLL